jgi:integrase
VPAYLTPDEVARFLDTFDRHNASGQRGYAMARCLVDMGLRAGEVAAIQLDDVNWCDGTLIIGRGKSRRADVLPLPAPTEKLSYSTCGGQGPRVRTGRCSSATVHR